jgi:hypothetical protein
MMFSLPKLGQLHRTSFGQQIVSEVVAAIGEEPRPIPVIITFEKARKKAATTAIPANLF